ncbi:MAG TPA: sigma-70 family RNA polymerase sigma factor [Acidimicrobiales bacterium]
MSSDDDLPILVEAAVHGDDVALSELVRRTQPVVWRVCSALGSRGLVEDLVQETYLRAMRALPSFRGDAPVRAWLLSIARNVCADHVRRRDRESRLLRKLHLERSAGHHEQAHNVVVDDLVRRLDPDRREAFVLTQLSGLSYADAAVALDCPIGTIRSRVARARADLLTMVNEADASSDRRL